ncbi:MAG: LysE family transporter [Deltaproteobacteria bacterium]|nr:LysE family transporter [Deltaproteobacteria bacterium]
MLIALALGFGMSFVGTMPVAGPISLLVLARGLDGRHRSGLLLAAGGAVGEGGYAALAWLGVGALLPRFPALLHVSRALAAAILVTLGLVFLLRRAAEPAAAPAEDGGGGSFALGLTIAALNPTFLATWTGAVTVAHAAGAAAGVWVAPAFAVGVVAGAVAWFWVLLALVRRYRGRFRPAVVQVVLRVLGAAIAALGLWFAVEFVRNLA